MSPQDVCYLTFIAGRDSAAVVDIERRPRADRATSEKLCSLDVVAPDAEDGAEVWPVRVAGEKQFIRTGWPLGGV